MIAAHDPIAFLRFPTGEPLPREPRCANPWTAFSPAR